MPKIPRDINSQKLIKLLEKYGYQVDRQVGSHIRLCTIINQKKHSITIPAHNPLKIGTLNKILNEIANNLNITKNELINSIF
ncbi:MAG: type II toxin-antitoxin system HicA family toxin [Candidatus Muiribacteriota bacterium]